LREASASVKRKGGNGFPILALGKAKQARVEKSTAMQADVVVFKRAVRDVWPEAKAPANL
jgi:hypothetical protein